MEILEHLLGGPPPAADLGDFATWCGSARQPDARFTLPFDRAVALAASCDRLGLAFAGGYQAAGRSIFPGFPDGELGALCATEAGGAHPRAIQTTLTRDDDGARLDGAKTFVTLGLDADRMFIVAKEGEADGRPVLRVVGIDARDGVTRRPGATLPFVPEIAHAELGLEGVRVNDDEILPGDGYADYLKPFRTVEDVHVHGALVAWWIGVGRRASWPAEALEELAAMLCTLRSLAQTDPKAAATHVALAGSLAATAQWLKRHEALWEAVPSEVAERFARDRPLLQVAGKARGKRREAAWRRLSGAR